MKRRTFLTAATATLALPAIARSESTRVLKFIPHADLTVLDPIWTTAYVTRNHGYLIFDTLYGSTADLKPEPQMVEGHNVENDGKLWKLTLRPRLRFHDGEPVLARDCVASIRRWGRRDTFGQGLMAATDEIAAADDKTIVFRLKKPFPLLPNALGKPGSNFCAIMPERVAKTDPFTQVSEMVGSGPYRWSGSERVIGSLAVYNRFADYHSRETGQASFTAGPKIANFDRIEWHIIPDAGTAAAALQSGEVDWWENPTSDMLPLLQRAGKIKVEVADPSGQIGTLRLNHLHPPFNNPEIRRALLSVTNQQDFMEAVAGDDDTFWTVPVGFFMPGSPMASNVGLDVFNGPQDYDRARKSVAAAGYKAEKVVLLVGTDVPILKAEADVAADMMTKAGFAVDYQAMDWGTVVQRRAKKDPPSQGGWNAFCTFWAGYDEANPAVNAFLRGNGAEGTVGWPSSPKIEQLRDEWLDTPDLATQQRLAAEIQRQAFIDVPYIPLGQYRQATAYRDNLTGVTKGFPVFWNVRRT